MVCENLENFYIERVTKRVESYRKFPPIDLEYIT